MKALDLFCCAGGASDGLVRAGFEVYGVDVEAQPEYPWPFWQADALNRDPSWIRLYVLAATTVSRERLARRRRPHEVEGPALNLIPQTRELLRTAGVPYVIENVPGAPLEDPTRLCGSMFGLDVQRHRIFECSFPVSYLACRHDVWTPRFPGATNRAPMSRKTVEVGVYRIPIQTQREAMGVDRPVSLHKLSQMVPPAYAEWLGLQARTFIMTQRRPRHAA